MLLCCELQKIHSKVCKLEERAEQVFLVGIDQKQSGKYNADLQNVGNNVFEQCLFVLKHSVDEKLLSAALKFLEDQPKPDKFNKLFDIYGKSDANFPTFDKYAVHMMQMVFEPLIKKLGFHIFNDPANRQSLYYFAYLLYDPEEQFVLIAMKICHNAQFSGERFFATV